MADRGFIYIMTNEGLGRDTVKIGFATDVEERRKSLSGTALPYDYEVYATYETLGNLEDKKLHRLIDKLNPTIRINANREFYKMTAEDAYTLLESIAIISGTQDKLHKVITEKISDFVDMDEEDTSSKETTAYSNTKKAPRFKFSMVHIPVGSRLMYKCDPNIICTTIDDNNKVDYNGHIYTLSRLVHDLRYEEDSKTRSALTYQGPSYFLYNGKLLTDLRAEVEQN